MFAITNGVRPTQAAPSYTSTVNPSGSSFWIRSGSTHQWTNVKVCHDARSRGSETCCSAVMLTILFDHLPMALWRYEPTQRHISAAAGVHQARLPDLARQVSPAYVRRDAAEHHHRRRRRAW